jgi:hypothetical protein
MAAPLVVAVVHRIVRVEIPKSNPDHLGATAFGCGHRPRYGKVVAERCNDERNTPRFIGQPHDLGRLLPTAALPERQCMPQRAEQRSGPKNPTSRQAGGA